MMFLDWLRHIRKRDFYYIFGGFFGLIVLTTLLITKCAVDQETHEVTFQQARREQQLHEERQRARERRQAEDAARKKREDQERLRAAQLAELRRLGVRGIPISAAPTDAYQNLGVWLKVRSEPEGADVYFNWAHKGKTPLLLRGAEVAGLLLMAKEDHEAWFRDITHHENGALTAELTSNTPHPRTRLVLAPANDMQSNTFAFLRSRLSNSGFIIPEAGAAEDFQRTERAAGGLANHGFRAWARTKFAADVLLRASVRERNRDIGTQSRVLAGTVRVFVDLDFDVYDLRTGEHLAVITAAESAFGIDHMQGFQKALEAVTTDAVYKLQAQLKR